jgi:hypothetical protein
MEEEKKDQIAPGDRLRAIRRSIEKDRTSQERPNTIA